MELDNIDVAGDYQRKGIGKAMVDFIESLAKNLGKKYVTLAPLERQNWKTLEIKRLLD